MDSNSTDICSRLTRSIVWASLPAQNAAVVAHQKGDAPAAAREFVRYLRSRHQPYLGFTREFIAQVRAAANTELRTEAIRAVQLAVEQRCGGRGKEPLMHLTATTLHLGARREDFEAMAQRLGDNADDWVYRDWGATDVLCVFLQKVWSLEECSDEALIPVLALLIEQSTYEWEERTSHWDDGLLGPDGHNWWLHSLCGLWKAGLFFPEIAALKMFRALAPAWLERELNTLMQPDGFSRERSGYHWGSAHMLYDCALLAESNGIELNAAFHEHLRAVAAATWKLLTPDGDIPLDGDTSPCLEPGRHFGLLRQLAARFEMPEAKYIAEQLSPHWQNVLEGVLPDSDGSNLWAKYSQLAPAPHPELDSCLPHSGYYVMRQNWTPTADWCCIDAGSRGNIVTSHDHAAIFNLHLYARGRAILIDNSSGAYGDNPSRQWRKSSAAHNVATVDGASQVKAETQWRWASRVLPTVDVWRSENKYSYFSGAHEGYVENGVVCRRKLFYLRGEYWILLDRFTVTDGGAAHHLYEQHFHLNAPAEIYEGGRVVTTGNGGNLEIVPIAGAAGEAILEPNPFPLDGYDNPSHLSYAHGAEGNFLFVTVLVPFEGNRPAVTATLQRVETGSGVLSPWQATVLEIEINGRRDFYFDQHTHWNLPWQVGEYSGCSRLFHSEIGVLS